MYCPLEKQYRNVAREKKSSSEFWRAFFLHAFSGPFFRATFAGKLFFPHAFLGPLVRTSSGPETEHHWLLPKCCLQSFPRKRALHVTPASVTESNIFCNSFMNASLHLSGCPSLGVNSTWILCGKIALSKLFCANRVDFICRLSPLWLTHLDPYLSA